MLIGKMRNWDNACNRIIAKEIKENVLSKGNVNIIKDKHKKKSKKKN